MPHDDPPELETEPPAFITWTASIQADLDQAGHTSPDCHSYYAGDVDVTCSCGVTVPYSILWGAA